MIRDYWVFTYFGALWQSDGSVGHLLGNLHAMAYYSKIDLPTMHLRIAICLISITTPVHLTTRLLLPPVLLAGALLIIVALIEIFANWFLAWLLLSALKDVSWIFILSVILQINPFLIVLLLLLLQERGGGTKMRKRTSEILMDNDVLQYSVCWLSLNFLEQPSRVWELQE